ncbi:hypothetical protein MJO29_002455 [Puccinia striiformis f. sp. tritici]|uniref:Uncharacterized protein n=2 Tax=Puccinia striiformis TaxID=27350 RepID=A0A0L0UY01_9BASI|nr:hypothetical protein Pst134EA_002423 [Puccinia striiformis f. sp. tritici]XP_047811241.1 hypothetical protein Pst134EA_002427 [Puccinia striiformis f. sp. tritici]KAI9627240.1 hypothetical protein H4Q26_017472 [Puccinia striiformis f. sp. tritici PST-130]KNE91895.1 hypothetical protein PSTG_14692 [Puccinia striiformis f. sp. tritici PST-78]POW09692.1 hypothetical protein PSHT_09043 [Puccinia striiformis]KAH9471782.1 hypothetical protein Pst134EA_002423 [Puccinia striiformis f. sp. tritici]
MLFQSSLLLGLLAASAALGRTIVNLDQETGTILHKRSPFRPYVENPHSRNHIVHKQNPTGVIGPAAPKAKENKGDEANAKAIAAQQEVVNCLRAELDAAIVKLEKLKSGQVGEGGEEEKEGHHKGGSSGHPNPSSGYHLDSTPGSPSPAV